MKTIPTPRSEADQRPYRFRITERPSCDRLHQRGDHADQVAQSGQDADLVCRIRQEMERNGKALESMRFKEQAK